MFDWFIVTLWFELNNKLYIKHYPNQLVSDCKSAVIELIEVYEEKYPLRKLRAVKCNEPSVWFKKYKLNKWEIFKEKENN
tara:strand:+ start:10738 stop:10977 length:240 start_codon:yes stop_codon:yes gene_type:complete